MATGAETEGAHPETISWDEHAEEMGRVRAELTAEVMRLEALLDERNREIESLCERLPQLSDAPGAEEMLASGPGSVLLPDFFKVKDRPNVVRSLVARCEIIMPVT